MVGLLLVSSVGYYPLSPQSFTAVFTINKMATTKGRKQGKAKDSSVISSGFHEFFEKIPVYTEFCFFHLVQSAFTGHKHVVKQVSPKRTFLQLGIRKYLGGHHSKLNHGDNA